MHPEDEVELLGVVCRRSPRLCAKVSPIVAAHVHVYGMFIAAEEESRRLCEMLGWRHDGVICRVPDDEELAARAYATYAVLEAMLRGAEVVDEYRPIAEVFAATTLDSRLLPAVLYHARVAWAELVADVVGCAHAAALAVSPAISLISVLQGACCMLTPLNVPDDVSTALAIPGFTRGWRAALARFRGKCVVAAGSVFVVFSEKVAEAPPGSYVAKGGVSKRILRQLKLVAEAAAEVMKGIEAKSRSRG